MHSSLNILSYCWLISDFQVMGKDPRHFEDMTKCFERPLAVRQVRKGLQGHACCCYAVLVALCIATSIYAVVMPLALRAHLHGALVSRTTRTWHLPNLVVCNPLGYDVRPVSWFMSYDDVYYNQTLPTQVMQHVPQSLYDASRTRRKKAGGRWETGIGRFEGCLWVQMSVLDARARPGLVLVQNSTARSAGSPAARSPKDRFGFRVYPTSAKTPEEFVRRPPEVGLDGRPSISVPWERARGSRHSLLWSLNEDKKLDYSRFSTRVGLYPRYRTTRAYSWEFTEQHLSWSATGEDSWGVLDMLVPDDDVQASRYFFGVSGNTTTTDKLAIRSMWLKPEVQAHANASMVLYMDASLWVSTYTQVDPFVFTDVMGNIFAYLFGLSFIFGVVYVMSDGGYRWLNPWLINLWKAAALLWSRLEDALCGSYRRRKAAAEERRKMQARRGAQEALVSHMARIRPGAERKQEEEAKSSSSEALRAVEEGVRWPTQPTPQEEPSCLGEGARQATSAAQRLLTPPDHLEDSTASIPDQVGRLSRRLHKVCMYLELD